VKVEPAAEQKGGPDSMTRTVLFLTLATLAISPAVSLAQSKTADAGRGARVDEPTTGGTGQTMKDSWLTTKTKMALITDKRVKARRVAVETQGGVVTLRGKVATAAERIAAEEIAKDVNGVKSVSNALQIVPEVQRKHVDEKDDGIKKAVTERLERDGRLRDADIKVRSDNSVVTLMGIVHDAKTKTYAADLTRGVPGVRAVRNELR
jgi:hyperosmotically inducible protein